MKILFLLPNLTGSGAEKNTMRLAQNLASDGHDVALVLLEEEVSHEIPEGLKVHTLTRRKNAFKPLGRMGDWIYYRLLRPYLEEVDLLISTLPRADRVAALHKGRTLFVIRMSYKEELRKFSLRRSRKKLRLYQKIYRNKDLITVSEAMQEDLRSLKIPFRSIRTVYNGFDFEEIRRKAREYTVEGEPYIVSPNAFRVQKRYDVLLDAMTRLRSPIKLLILAREDPELEAMIRSRNLEDRVEVLGFRPNPYPYIRNAKLTVLSSDREGLPTVLIESLILGTPVVSTDCPTGPREILHGEMSRWLVPTTDSEALARKIDEALQSDISIDPELIRPFRREEVLRRYREIIDASMGGKDV